MWNTLYTEIRSGNRKSLARCISLVENEMEGYYAFLKNLPQSNVPVIGITGPPGAGKSTLTDALIGKYMEDGKKVAVLCVDPSSPFNMGALLGDRIRMSRWYNEENVFIRSLATRGSLGGLHPKIIEITDILKASGFDFIIVETVGVGQSEIEIAGLADVTIVTIVPEAGDEIQTMKAGIMEIADMFVVNKADRPGAETFVKNLRLMLAPAFHNHAEEIEVIKTIAHKNEGVENVKAGIEKIISAKKPNERKVWLKVEKAYHLIQKEKMKNIDKALLKQEIETLKNDFNMYSFIEKYKSQ
jgi:LAO/AO transport system kinase